MNWPRTVRLHQTVRVGSSWVFVELYECRRYARPVRFMKEHVVLGTFPRSIPDKAKHITEGVGALCRGAE